MTIYNDFCPSQDATVVTRLTQAGAMMLGKLQRTEGAYAAQLPKIDPSESLGRGCLAGASSCGSGIAPAAGHGLRSLGSDTGGSIVFPRLATG